MRRIATRPYSHVRCDAHDIKPHPFMFLVEESCPGIEIELDMIISPGSIEFKEESSKKLRHHDYWRCSIVSLLMARVKNLQIMLPAL